MKGPFRIPGCISDHRRVRRIVVGWPLRGAEEVHECPLGVLAALDLRHPLLGPFPELSKVLVWVFATIVAESEPETPGLTTSLNDALELRGGREQDLKRQPDHHFRRLKRATYFVVLLGPFAVLCHLVRGIAVSPAADVGLTLLVNH